MLRQPAVAGQFYPGTAGGLAAEINKYIVPDQETQEALVAISPHAGYVYSGAVAGEVFSRVKMPQRVLVAGPNHRGMGGPVALMSSGSWQTPLGLVELDSELAELIKGRFARASEDAQAHQFEHSLEVQVPFLQVLRDDLLLTPLCLSFLDLPACLALGKAIASAITALGEPVLMVASTDMTHYESAEEAAGKDQMALDRVLDLDPEGLFNTVRQNGISMCGVLPTTVCLAAARELGAKTAELVRYTHSGVVSGDYKQVVGYAGALIS